MVQLSDKATCEAWTEESTDHLLLYLYDETGTPIGLRYRNSDDLINP